MSDDSLQSEDKFAASATFYGDWRNDDSRPLTPNLAENDDNNVTVEVTVAAEDPVSTNVVGEPKAKRGRKPDKERLMSGRRDWEEYEVVRLIDLWRDSEILYNTSHASYYVNNERKAVLEMISHELDIPVKDIQDKMHSLRTYFGVQKQKLEGGGSKQQSRLVAKELAVSSRWKYYDMMMFLSDSLQSRTHGKLMPSGTMLQRIEMHTENENSNRRRTFRHVTSSTVPRLQNCRTTESSLYASQNSFVHSNSNADYSNMTSHDSVPDEEEWEEKPELVFVDESSNVNTIALTTSPFSNESSVTNVTNVTSTDVAVSPARRQDATTSRDPSREVHSSRDVHPGVGRRSDDELFGDVIVKSLGKITDEEVKERVKIEVQTLLFNARFKDRISANLVD